MDDLRIAAVCMRSQPGRIEQNLERIRGFALEAAGGGADLVCFPELSVTGYALTDPESLCRGRDAPELTAPLLEIAKEAGLLVLAGMVEPRKGGRPHIGHMIAGPDGLLGVHRKTHLSPMEREVFSPGEELAVFTWRKTTFGVQLCYEAHFPEITTVMALNGAEVVLFPHASPRGGGEEKLASWMRHLTARAFDNGIFAVACNQVGETDIGVSFPGAALVVGPDGRVMASRSGCEEMILHARLTAERLTAVRGHRMRYFLPWRRPELYRNLLKT